MMRRAQILVSLLVGLTAGYFIGGWQLAPLLEAPVRPNSASNLDDSADLSGPATPVDAALADMLAGRRDPRRALPVGPTARAAEAALESEVLVPSTAGENRAPDEDASLIPRGPGRFALLDLGAADISRLTIRQGSMPRDGDGRFAPFAKQPKVGQLRGRVLRVELLHLGFNGEGQATVAHIRTTDTPPVEGVVSLLHDERRVVVRPAPPEPAPAATGDPTAEDPAASEFMGN